ncbi:hypothetical protein PYW08_014312 [Mythimna loreyi]|uniref:Uncharacterized protein n=1 Tax=Mythimna loreyi TaxID=667449 RepID=A0ACC2RB42_9NEOP|nr:hypothetical protein PYW08_014312 [Mythimna loreyi]
MKAIVFSAFLVAEISAFLIPGINIDLPDQHFINNLITKSINTEKQSIKDTGLDPLYINETHIALGLPVAVLFSAQAYAKEILCTGLSDIVTHNVSYNLRTSIFSFGIELPRIDLSVGAASLEAILFSNTFDVKASGKVEIERIRIAGKVHVDIAIFSGITIRQIKIAFTLGNIIPNIKLVAQGKDYSAKINYFIGTNVTSAIKAHKTEINKLLEIVMKNVMNERLP